MSKLDDAAGYEAVLSRADAYTFADANETTVVQACAAGPGSQSNSVTCPLLWKAVGPILGTLRVAGGGAVGTFLLRVFSQPTVSALTPTVLPLQGGSSLRIAFAARVRLHSGSVNLRLNNSGHTVSVDLVVEASGSSAVGKLPVLPAFSNDTAVSAELALNGQSFLATGITGLTVETVRPLKTLYLLRLHPGFRLDLPTQRCKVGAVRPVRRSDRDSLRRSGGRGWVKPMRLLREHA